MIDFYSSEILLKRFAEYRSIRAELRKGILLSRSEVELKARPRVAPTAVEKSRKEKFAGDRSFEKVPSRRT